MMVTNLGSKKLQSFLVEFFHHRIIEQILEKEDIKAFEKIKEILDNDKK